MVVALLHESELTVLPDDIIEAIVNKVSIIFTILYYTGLSKLKL